MILNKKNIAIIGAGISGLTVANLLRNKFDITIFEREDRPGGLIKCDMIEGSLFHTCGGHVFNTKRNDVFDLFWGFFNKTKEFSKATRNSVVFMPNGLRIPYPIENHAYLFDDELFIPFLKDMTNGKDENKEIENFQEFLKDRFGNTLYELYFKPYNEKVWRRDLSQVPLTWLQGKLPMPTRDEIIYNNVRRVEEKEFVHSTFWYEREGGSQMIANRMAENLKIRYNSSIESIKRVQDKWIINLEEFDIVIFCGNIKQLPRLLGNYIVNNIDWIEQLDFHGTTSVFCEIENNPYSWIYLPDHSIEPHRIICTGNFSTTNNAPGKMTGSIEFTDYISKDEILDQLSRTPLVKRYITHKYNKYTYPIQGHATKEQISSLKDELAKVNFYMTGRFADWEYYNMDTAMGAAMDMVKNYNLI
ncbi:MAG: NAD(P)-binding protein [Muribaculaceae bacterium]|nr:NAD(P)-binding protein [Muribaculaceae bacterium]